MPVDLPSAIEVTITHLQGVGQMATRRVRARCLPGLTPIVPLPNDYLELQDGDGEPIFRRLYGRPSMVEIPGRSPRWVRLPDDHRQVLVALVPDLPRARRIVAFKAGVDWSAQLL